MTAKEKAIELVEKYLNNIEDKTGTFILSMYSSKQCAIICVNEMIETAEIFDYCETMVEFYVDVKTEIENL